MATAENLTSFPRPKKKTSFSYSRIYEKCIVCETTNYLRRIENPGTTYTSNIANSWAACEKIVHFGKQA